MDFLKQVGQFFMEMLSLLLKPILGNDNTLFASDSAPNDPPSGRSAASAQTAAPSSLASYLPGTLAAAFRPAVAPVTDTPHMRIAERFCGLQEERDGGQLNDFINGQLGTNTNLRATIDVDETPWCAAFINAVEVSAGRGGTKNMMARSFLDYGEEAPDPRVGDIVVLTRPLPNGGTGHHVGYYAGHTEDGKLRVLGGNQKDSVCYQSWDAEQVVAYRRPPPVPRPAHPGLAPSLTV